MSDEIGGNPLTGGGSPEQALRFWLHAPAGPLRRRALMRAVAVAQWLDDRGVDDVPPARLRMWIDGISASAVTDAPAGRGTYVSHPFNAAMCAAGPAEDVDERGTSPWEIALLASLRAATLQGPGDESRQDWLYRASLSLRKVLEHRARGLLCDLAGVDALVPSIDVVQEAKALALATTVAGTAPSVASLFESLETLVGLLERLHAGAAPRRRGSEEPRQLVDLPDSSLRDRVQLPEVDIEALRAAEDAPQNSDDDAPDMAVEVEVVARTGARALDLGDIAEHACFVREEVACEAATRPTRPGPLTLGELAWMWRVLEESPDLGARDRTRARVALLFTAGLGIAWEHLQAYTAALGAAGWPDLTRPPPAPGIALFRAPGSQAWQGVRALPGPQLTGPPDQADPRWFHPAAPLFWLPLDEAMAHALAEDLLACGRCVRDARGYERLEWGKGAVRLSHWDKVVPAVRKALPRHRLDAGRLPHVMDQALREVGADDLDTALVTGRVNASQVAAYYTSLPVRELADLYTRAQARLCARLGFSRPVTDPPSAPIRAPEDMRVGSRRVPTPAAVIAAASALQGDVCASMPSSFDPPEPWLAHHEARVHRWAFLLHAGFGLRRSRRAFQGLTGRDRDLQHGWLALRDKGALRRLLPLSPVLRRYWLDWGIFLEAMATTALGWAHVDAAVLSGAESAWRAGDLVPATLTRFSLVGDRVVATDWRPEDLDACLAAHGIRVPTQFWRHAARTRLCAWDVPTEQIGALLGHYTYGREPSNAGTLYSADRFLDELAAMIDGSWQEMGVPAGVAL